MTTTPMNTIVRLNDPGELVAAVPHLIGFHPQDSLVALTLHGVARNRLGLTLRTDLPPPDKWEDCARQVLGPVVQHRASAVLLAVVGGVGAGETADAPPRAALVEHLDAVMGEAGVPVMHSLWAADTRQGSTWRCYDEVDCTGLVADSAASAVAAATAAAGFVTFDSRRELERLLDPDCPESLSRRIVSLDAALDESEHEEAPTSSEQTDRNIAAVWNAIDTCARGEELAEDDIISVGLALSDPRVRDVSLAALQGDRAAAAEQLWLRLTRALPAPEVAEAATLLAFAAYLRGDGALAGLALDRAESAVPGHRLAELLRRTLQAGLPPGKLSTLITDAVEDARLCMDEEDE